MAAPGSEIHELALMEAEHAVEPPLHQEGQVRIRAEAAVAQQHVARGQRRVDGRQLARLMAP